MIARLSTPKANRTLCALILVMAAAGASLAPAQSWGPEYYDSMKWRMIGPHRGGRTVAAVGVPEQPNLFYIGVNNGGVWRSNDYGRTWTPIFDDQPTGSIGAIGLAPSDPKTIYVGSGEGLHRPDLSTGDGVYKSTDAGNTWRHMGLRDGEQICTIIVDPKNPNRLFVAVLGHPYGPNEERGIFRSTNGGESWSKVLYKDENTGGNGLEFAPDDPNTLYAVLWQARRGPWENAAWQGANSGMFKSTDGGDSWKPLTKGLPTFAEGLGRIGIAVSPSEPKRLYAMVDASRGGLYRSDDAGESWRLVCEDRRIWGRGYDFAEVKVDPQNADIVYAGNVGMYKSTDGGHTFKAIRGAPGGDDYHRTWINPLHPEIMLLAADQGAIVTVNGGETYSSWYNQPTSAFYHVITDNQFPYNVYGGQQESGSVGITSRSDDGQITFRDWHPVGVTEYGPVAPDPLNPDIIYGGKVTRFNRKTGQKMNVAPEAIRSGEYRFVRTAALRFSPVDQTALYLGANVLFKTTNGGDSWEVISPDLTREKPEIPESVGIYRTTEMESMARRGVIYAVAPSYVEADTIWAGTDDGLIHLTTDGGWNWKDVTPPEITAWSKISVIDAGRFDPRTAYVAVNRIRCNDQRPHIYRTHDGGQSWTEIVRGLPENGPVNAVREDRERQGLLFCGTERAVYVSFNHGDQWLPLRLNMPATSIRDLVVHDNDLVVGTHGRSFWILDDVTPLRQMDDMTRTSPATLFLPQVTYRMRRNNYADTPLPFEEPAGQNPPDGAIINYYLKQDAKEPVTLEIYAASGELVWRFSSDDAPEKVDENSLTYPAWWVRPPQILSAKAGSHRFVWNQHYPPQEGSRRSYPISAIYRDTPSNPLGPSAAPGIYTVKLIVDGELFVRPMLLKMDPRVETSEEGLARQFAISKGSYDNVKQIQKVQKQQTVLKEQIQDRQGKVEEGVLADALDALAGELAAMEQNSEATFAQLSGNFSSLCMR